MFSGAPCSKQAHLFILALNSYPGQASILLSRNPKVVRRPLPLIKAQAPRLLFIIAPLTQTLLTPVNIRQRQPPYRPTIVQHRWEVLLQARFPLLAAAYRTTRGITCPKPLTFSRDEWIVLLFKLLPRVCGLMVLCILRVLSHPHKWLVRWSRKLVSKLPLVLGALPLH